MIDAEEAVRLLAEGYVETHLERVRRPTGDWQECGTTYRTREGLAALGYRTDSLVPGPRRAALGYAVVDEGGDVRQHAMWVRGEIAFAMLVTGCAETQALRPHPFVVLHLTLDADKEEFARRTRWLQQHPEAARAVGRVHILGGVTAADALMRAEGYGR